LAKKLNVGVLGAGAWANGAHIPGYQRDPRFNVAAVCDIKLQLAEETARKFDIPFVTVDYKEVLERDDIDIVDVSTPSHTHLQLTLDALEAGKHVLCEKPVGFDFHDTLKASDKAKSKGLKTKVGLTFRYSPAMRYMNELVSQGYVGTPYVFNGYEQNSQWLDPDTPLRQVPDPYADQSEIQVSSLEGYGAPIIDIAHWLVGSDLGRVIGTMKNFIPERVVRETGKKMRITIDDGDIFVGEFQNGALCSIQTSFVTVGNYPGIEARLYGSKGALICRLVEENGICETLRGAIRDAVEFKEIQVAQRFYPTGGSPTESWRTLFYANLVSSFASEILEDKESEGNFVDAAWVTQVINAVERSFRERRWVELPLN
jgi:predicted dehydrogenase